MVAPLRLLLAGASSLLLASASLLAERQTAAPETVGLHRLMVNAGKLYFGTAIETNNFADQPYRAISDNPDEFGLLVPENSQKWEAIQPRPGNFSFDAADSIVRLARTNGQLFRCHTLTWHSQLPPFVANGTWTAATLTAVLQTHITSVISHYRGLCYAWDVVNEALNENGTLRASVFARVLGPAFLPLSFVTAAAADPLTKLYYNDFNLETTPLKTAGALRIVQQVQAAGAPIHGVGFQAHFRVGTTPNRTALVALQRRFTALGLETSFTELDVAHAALPANASSRAQQVRDYVGVVQACLDVAECKGIVVWQFTDKYSWIPGTFPGLGEACLWDKDYNKKEAYTAVASVLAAAATAAPSRGTNGSVVGGGGTDATDRLRSGAGQRSAVALGGLVGALGAAVWLVL